ncbi:zinc-binding alcohol dehydrogenase family protein [Fructilactobacillus cliffordii]|uniref:Zinc-type alcohol dehydrogenase-like protein n=1 Tax=Fructilactobacillus cliffordii TaxID=2940299 RepID=A0A9Q9E2R4_9LACO|nr:zinc-binding alcohol dehydrogenase family protein [Fructilactobacillus cliffordii]USS89074.1 zinc-binding alcohol dehydrogenase family protein [Fructilactobacillus cliffordii]
MPELMNAIGYTHYLPIDNPESLFEFKTDVPTLADHDLLIQVDAVSVNPVDIFTRKRQSSTLTEPKIIGYDAVGTVIKTGSTVSLFHIGDRVFYAGAYNRPGSNSEYQAVDERIVGHAPQQLTTNQAAAMPLTSLTAWESLFEQMNIDLNNHEVNAQQSILIINGAGGVGSVATQLAHLAGLQVIATAGNPQTKDWTLQHGADYTVDYHQNLVEQVHQLGFETVNYVLELQNLDHYWDDINQLIAPLGTIVSTTGSGKDLNFQPLKRKMVRFGWEWMYTKSWYQTPNLITQHEILDQVSQLLDQGQLQSTLTKTFSPINAENLRAATKLVESHQMMGKVVVEN